MSSPGLVNEALVVGLYIYFSITTLLGGEVPDACCVADF